MSEKQIEYVFDRETGIKKERRIELLLDIAEALNYAYVGSQATEKGKTNKGAKQYEKWRKNKLKELYPDIVEPTVWDNLKTLGKSKKFN